MLNKTLVYIIFLLSFPSYSSEPVEISDLEGSWKSDNSYGNYPQLKNAKLVSVQGGLELQYDDNNFLFCPDLEITVNRGVFDINCLNSNGEARVRLVISGWKSKNKIVLFGFHYLVGGISGYPDSVFGGQPISLTKN